MQRITYQFDILLSDQAHAPESVLINTRSDTKIPYGIHSDNEDNAALHNNGFANNSTININNNTFLPSYNYLLQDNLKITNIGSGLYLIPQDFESNISSSFSGRFGSSELLFIDANVTSDHIILFERIGDHVGVYRNFASDSISIDDKLYINLTSPISYGSYQPSKAEYDQIAVDYTVAASSAGMDNWEFVDHFEFFAVDELPELDIEDPQICILKSQRFPLYQNGTVVYATDATLVQVDESYTIVDLHTGIITIDIVALADPLVDIRGFYILYGSVPSVIIGHDVQKYSVKDVDFGDGLNFLHIGNRITHNHIIASDRDISLLRGIEYDGENVQFIPDCKDNIFLSTTKNVLIDGQNRKGFIRLGKDKQSINVAASKSLLEPVTETIANDGTIQLPSFWNGTDVLIYASHDGIYVPICGTSNPNEIPYDATPTPSNTHIVNPVTDGVTISTADFYIPTSVVVTEIIDVGNTQVLTEGVEYELRHPDKVVFKRDLIHNTSTYQIDYDLAAQFVPELVDGTNKIIKFTKYADIYTIYSPPIDGLYSFGPQQINISVGYTTESYEDIVIPDQQITLKVNATSDFLEQYLYDFKGT